MLNVIFWCKVKDLLNNKIYKLERKIGKHFAVGIDDIFIGSTEFQIQNENFSSPKIEIEVGYFYDSGYTGSVPPFPGSMKKVITLTPFCKVLTC
ncbi:hypothetical protein [Pectobacterium wasabiae]|uniref:hypothetical protein n=1 Tax=Pectobacterium wasabiae TaxID=55208 RepID=UPI00027B00E7|nr:hypothetical protein [Pectobacterium wasabiae]AOR62534.1 hypothetical protein A7983_04460 [Pectobacterium wasabiae CFBP 3304]EJS93780.1 Hypothetical protein Y17_3035 [Pectobacterium wasabiae CFBP 3304]